jgi:phosphoribosylglycinamide formyltransferase-1
MQSKRLAVLVSQGGTNLDAILDSGIEVSVVVADRQCRALDIAAKKGKCRAVLMPRHLYMPQPGEFDRERYAKDLLGVLRQEQIDLVMMAGFLTVLDKRMFEAYPFSIINTHASLLPAFPGLNPIKQAWDYGVLISGCTLHYATAEVDRGQIIDQRWTERKDSDTFATFSERIKAIENRMVVENLRMFVR